jgi:hypothetical protein
VILVNRFRKPEPLNPYEFFAVTFKEEETTKILKEFNSAGIPSKVVRGRLTYDPDEYYVDEELK